MKQFLYCAAAFTLLACSNSSVEQVAAPGPSSGWTLNPGGTLNDFFDCHDDAGQTLVSAHRGGPRPGFPENALETIQETLKSIPAMVEIDVATSRDGVLFLMHDDTLDRTTTGEGVAAETEWATVRSLNLIDNNGRRTDFHPPKFADVIAAAKGRTIIQIYFKRSTRFEDVIDEVNRQDAEGSVVYIAYSMAQAYKLHRLAPGAMISLSIEDEDELASAIAAGVPADRLLAFTGLDDPNPRLNQLLQDRGIEVIFGTLGGRNSIDNAIRGNGNEALYSEFSQEGVDILATDRPVEAHEELSRTGRAAKPGACGVTSG